MPIDDPTSPRSKVVCDTNIWFDLGEGRLDHNKFKDQCLIATFYNFEELTTTPKTVSDFHKVRRACKAILEHSCDQILENSILYLAKLVNSRHEDTKDHYGLGKKNWDEVALMGKLSEGFIPTPEMLTLYQQNIDNKVRESNAVAEIENRLAAEVKKQARKTWNEDKKNYYKSSLKGIIGMLNSALKDCQAIQLLTKDFDIGQIGLFIGAWIEYYRQLEVLKMVAKPNDMYDLFNLIYVKPGMKYFTQEGRWNRIIIEAGLEHYIFKIPA
jgi:hypothetical protein